MSYENPSDPVPTNIPPLNETARLAKYIVSLFSGGGDPVDRRLSSSPDSMFNTSQDERLYNLLDNPKLKKDEAIIHVYILFVLLCYVVGTGLIVMKYIKKESSLPYFNSFPTRTISFTHMDSSEVWIKSTNTSCDTTSENCSEDDDSPSSTSERNWHLSSSSDVTYV